MSSFLHEAHSNFLEAMRLIRWSLVPKKGLEPPHPCEYMDLNHARLPIPPLRHETIQRDRLDRQQPLVYKSRP
jgi:hypothetical protein